MVLTTKGTLLDGRVSYRQSRSGHRTGIEPVLLAASVPARRGDLVLEAGTGAGAGLLCIAARVEGLGLRGIEADAATAALARTNLTENGHAAAVVVEAALPELPTGLDGCAHAFANPPWHDPGGTVSADPARALARHRIPGTIADWTGCLARLVRPGGTVTLIVPASLHAAAAAAFLAADCGGICLLPLWPRAGVAARLAILQARRGGRGPARILPGLVLHEADGAFTPDAESVLRGGAGLAL